MPWGSAGREVRLARLSRGWDASAEEVGAWAMRPTVEGVGVKGGSLVGDSDGAALRFLGSGVAGRSGIVKASFGSGFVGLLVGDVANALLLRFLGAVVGFESVLVDEDPFVPLVSVRVKVLLLATRAERLRDMLKCLGTLLVVFRRV
mgnify:CR=1 FL=1